jgi:Di-haem oxidoreductase, putative peroxidase/Cellulose binding domain
MNNLISFTKRRHFSLYLKAHGKSAAALVAFAFTAQVQAQVDLARVAQFHAPAAEHCIQSELMAIADPRERFIEAFDCGDELFATSFNAVDGVGANIGDGMRFARVPRADLTGMGQWADHFPTRATGPNAEACTACHNLPFEDGAGLAALNVVRDPTHSGNPAKFITRNTPHVFALSALQLLAEEMTTELQATRASAITQAAANGNSLKCSITGNVAAGRYALKVRVTNIGASTLNGWSVLLNYSQTARISSSTNVALTINGRTVTASNISTNGTLISGGIADFTVNGPSTRGFTIPTCTVPSGGASVTLALSAKGVSFGTITSAPNGTVNTTGIIGVDTDLVVKPFQWKGNFASLRDFNADAFHNELGMQPVETAGDGIDGDGDEVVDEIGIGDQTAMSIYLAAQPRPVSQLELNNYGILTLTTQQIASINHGEQIFQQIGCADCHTPMLTINNPVFSEPSQHVAYRHATFPAGQNPVAEGVDANNPVSFNITQDPPSNMIDFNGQSINIGAFEADAQGRALVRLYSDLRRHNMGPELAESIDEAGTGASVWKTTALWGVGSTPPYLHDGRATTLTEAIEFHGGEAATSRTNARNLSPADYASLISFLNSLVLYKVEEH